MGNVDLSRVVSCGDDSNDDIILVGGRNWWGSGKISRVWRWKC